MLSSTTIELSTSIPMPSAMPPSDMMLRVRSVEYMRLKVATTDTGIEIEMITVAQTSRRKKNSTRMARMPPKMPALMTSLTAWRMNTDWS